VGADTYCRVTGQGALERGGGVQTDVAVGRSADVQVLAKVASPGCVLVIGFVVNVAGEQCANAGSFLRTRRSDGARKLAGAVDKDCERNRCIAVARNDGILTRNNSRGLERHNHSAEEASRRKGLLVGTGVSGKDDIWISNIRDILSVVIQF